VNSATANEQSWPQIAVLTDGKFVVTYQSWLGDGDNYGVMAQLFAADGSPLGARCG
jgi:hypothetical protein